MKEGDFLTMNTSALVLLSGGQDSATCLVWAKKHFESIHTVGFDYGQRHIVELNHSEYLSYTRVI